MLALMALILVASLTQSIALNFFRYDDPRLPYVYADPSRVHFAGRRDQCDCVAVWFAQADRYYGHFLRLLAAALVLAGL